MGIECYYTEHSAGPARRLSPAVPGPGPGRHRGLGLPRPARPRRDARRPARAAGRWGSALRARGRARRRGLRPKLLARPLGRRRLSPRGGNIRANTSGASPRAEVGHLPRGVLGAAAKHDGRGGDGWPPSAGEVGAVRQKRARRSTGVTSSKRPDAITGPAGRVGPRTGDGDPVGQPALLHRERAEPPRHLVEQHRRERACSAAVRLAPRRSRGRTRAHTPSSSKREARRAGRAGWRPRRRGSCSDIGTALAPTAAAPRGRGRRGRRPRADDGRA